LGRLPIVSIDDPKNLPFADAYDFVAPFYMACFFVLLFEFVVVSFRKKLVKVGDRQTVIVLAAGSVKLTVSDKNSGDIPGRKKVRHEVKNGVPEVRGQHT
jgi:hypothetical protein